MKIELTPNEAWYIRALVAREKVNAEYSNKIYKEASGEYSEEFTNEIELCNSIIGKLNPFFDRKGRVINEVCEM